MGETVKLPIGIESFEEIRTRGFYYVDKTGLIGELLDNWGKVNLFTRPRRFGKSLNMNMLKYFFEYGCDSTLFAGLEISGEKRKCEQYMGKFPVISVTLKGVSAGTYGTARNMLCSVIGNEALRFRFLAESDRLDEEEKERYRQLVTIGTGGEAQFIMSDDVLMDSLLTLCRLLHRHYSQKVILLIDEYDVPLDKAQQYGYYDEMVSLIRNLFSQSLKSNASLEFAVLTGCLRIAMSSAGRHMESIFSGLNNLNALSIVNIRFDEYFGFTDREVREMLKYYGLEAYHETVRTWYDGYQFGNAQVYCPWDAVNYCAELRSDGQAFPRAFWMNSSENDILRKFLQEARPGTRRELEDLVNGEGVVKRINQELTYRDLYENTDNLWSVLFSAGYLTQRERLDTDTYRLVIPNQEIRQIFIEKILEWFREEAGKDILKLNAFCMALAKGDAETAEKYFCSYLMKTISIRDTGVWKNRKENFYYEIFLGLLGHQEEWYVKSNVQSGPRGILADTWYSDILVESEEESLGIVIVVRYSEEGDPENMEKRCGEALEQIERMDYEDRLRENGIEKILKYGFACHRKKCRVKCAKKLLT